MNITLITARPIDFLQAEFNHRFGFSVGLHLWQAGGFNFCRCFLETGPRRPSKREVKRFQEQVAEIVAAFIVERWEVALLEGMLLSQYEGLDAGAIEEICRRARAILDQGENSYLQLQQRGEPIAARILEYFQENTWLNIDGFVRFRLPDYLMELDQALEEAVDEYLMEKEYDEFIRLLRYFVEAQEPRVEKVHVVLSPGGGFQLYDGENRNLSGDYLEGFVVDMADSDLNYEDLLISALITIAPRQVVLHAVDKGRHHNTISTIKSVFGERLIHCSGCSRCLQPLQKR
ncbi:YtxC-like family protein [Neomoorella glycerini]|uniref:YtxC-like family protein n=1 Tax=Neomoorella glycerini TaxID=55779 RepID=A0A6I5ZM24_9FIRM|nr:putative sporulation protein YtxC [Moorella glycerini]QGP90888.1 YtxC-like family protein [Moorella glycerini]